MIDSKTDEIKCGYRQNVGNRSEKDVFVGDL